MLRCVWWPFSTGRQPKLLGRIGLRSRIAPDVVVMCVEYTSPLNVSYVVASDLADGSMPFPMHTCRISDDQIDAIQVKPRGSFKKPRRAGARRALTQLR